MHTPEGGWGGGCRGGGEGQCTLRRPSLFTVERLSLGLASFSVFFFLRGLSCSVYGERRGTTLPERKASFPKPQTKPCCGVEGDGGWGGGGAEVEEMLCLQFMFSTRRHVNTRRRKPGMRTRAHGCVSDKGAHAKTRRAGGRRELAPPWKKKKKNSKERGSNVTPSTFSKVFTASTAR